MDGYDDLSLSGQIEAAFGATAPTRKRHKREGDLFDILETDDAAISGYNNVLYPAGGLNASNDIAIPNSVAYVPQDPINFSEDLSRSFMDVDQKPVSITEAQQSSSSSSATSFPILSLPELPMPVSPTQQPSNPMSQVMTITPPIEILKDQASQIPTSGADSLITTARYKLEDAKVALEKLKWAQKETLQSDSPHPSSLERIRMMQHELAQSLSQIQSILTDLMSRYILKPVEIHFTTSLQNELDLLQKQLELYDIELRYHNSPPNQYIPAAALVITQHPFPKSVKQNKPMDDGVTVRLLTGAAINVIPAGPCEAHLITEHTSSRSKKSNANKTMIQNNVKAMENGVVQFTEILFPYGTRKKTIYLKFHLPVIVTRPGPYSQPMQFTIESNLSLPFIVKTNENQWDESEGILLKTEAFGSATEARWCHFANVLQKRYLTATKQDILKPQRPLTIQDLNYVYLVKFSPNGSLPTVDTMITTQAYDEFWNWFGPGLHRIRYQRHLCTLWVKGYICGFLQRQDVEKVLQSAEPGTFAIRLSERCPGQFALAYVLEEDNKRCISHYLIKPDDVFGAKKTLPDFLGQTRNLTHIVQITTDEHGNRVYRACSKDATLGEFYSKRDHGTPAGYDLMPPR